jgi:hypothetical protein
MNSPLPASLHCLNHSEPEVFKLYDTDKAGQLSNAQVATMLVQVSCRHAGPRASRREAGW